MFDFVVIGGGAAGVFAAIFAKTEDPSTSVVVIEKSRELLGKVRISGGGRCNLTNNCPEITTLVQNYPRGHEELLSCFYRFGPQDTMDWFEAHGAPLKVENEGKVFPQSDSSSTIIDVLLQELQNANIDYFLNQKILKVSHDGSCFCVELEDRTIESKKLLLATGSSKEGYGWAEEFGHTIVSPAPALFGFTLEKTELTELSGVAVESVELKLKGSSFSSTGALLITHTGLSGPAVLRLSSFAARELFNKNYHMGLVVNWVPESSEEEIFQLLCQKKAATPHKQLFSEPLFRIPGRLSKALAKEKSQKHFHELSHKALRELAHTLHADSYGIIAKGVQKEEFVTCGGILLKEIDFRTMESKMRPNLYFAGEILDIDGLTGGFNLQSAWTTGAISGRFAAKDSRI